ncbi:D-tagatose-bisphosphate aldolase, class II, non-catalytic subunit [Pararhizobium mangrovi]|uniref:D-tagatose-bisphosphate aldolase, class II, non-catalytic subunit n=1 Tax=Pararhizobium mangrovi TaxID=2590452 RepID=A0A506U3I4_9HYPH|nr:D-tagatose-bisphosphate aldolase, class II, non-catalytic subunit [Pararhizobium mangrovi]TPW28953.1 D-tagatose-bisphosphate aldolase, class II, non-catalytic subunit [Pararhizobium mangrovi]
MASRTLRDLASQNRKRKRGIPSVCSAHPVVLEAALAEARDLGTELLVEATCNQVNQEGGYTGMKPADFKRRVEDLADAAGFPREKLILGGDHLGPNPWKTLDADEAMDRAEAMVEAYVRAGFEKIHLDASMGCAGEPAALADEIVARRAARLAKVAERAADETGTVPVYVIGTEVPVPGGAQEAVETVEPTRPEAVRLTLDAHRRAFADAGVDDAFARAIAIVVQPGVEFGSEDVAVYDRARAGALSSVLADRPDLVFEAHSTDYQPEHALRELVEDGYAILKVGPALTFALREVYYGLAMIDAFLDEVPESERLPSVMERVMTDDPRFWQSHYAGNAQAQRRQRHFSYSDRIRYYWPKPEASTAVAALLARLEGVRVPQTMIGQYLGELYPAVREGRCEPTAEALVAEAVKRVLRSYMRACAPSEG